MAFTGDDELRIQAIENMLNDLQEVVPNLASQKQLRSLVVLKQKEINDLTTLVTALQSQVAALQSRP